MITNTPLLLFVLWAPILSWINISSSLILFGLYYGFLTTLPIDPSQILSIRTFLLEGNLIGTMTISGLIIGQLIIFLSICLFTSLYDISKTSYSHFASFTIHSILLVLNQRSFGLSILVPHNFN